MMSNVAHSSPAATSWRSPPTLGGAHCLEMKQGVCAASTEESNATETAGPG